MCSAGPLQDREAIRVRAFVQDGQNKEFRQFSVDPHITSYSHVHHLLQRAFHLNPGDFEISYQLPQSTENGKRPNVFLSLTSDFDLDAAFETAALPYLCLKVEVVKHLESLGIDQNGWTFLQAEEAPPANDIRSTGVSSYVPLHISLKHQVERTIQRFTRGFTNSSRRGPLKEFEWHLHLDDEGRVIRPEELWARVFQGGMVGHLRKEIWPHLLHVFPPDLTEDERQRHLLMKSQVYWHLKAKWEAQDPKEIESVTHLIMKDVLRTDRTYPYFAVPDDDPHMNALFNILTTYALANPDISYAQGMSDFAAPILVVMEEEALAYACFCALMTKNKSHFLLDGKAMTLKFEHLALLVQKMEPELSNYLMEIGAEDMFFCYRWLLLDLKREFPFNDALYLMEVIWSSLTSSGEVGLAPPKSFNSVGGHFRGNSEAILLQNGYLGPECSAPDCSDSDSDGENTAFSTVNLIAKSSNPEESLIQLPGPYQLGDGKPFVLFLCLAILSLHKDHCMQQKMDYNALAMYFDKMTRKHDLVRVLAKARSLFSDYLSSLGGGKEEDGTAKEEGTTWFDESPFDVPRQASPAFVEC